MSARTGIAVHFIRPGRGAMVGTVPALLKFACIGLAGMLIVAVLTVLITQRGAEGPVGFLHGGPFKTGARVDETVTARSFGGDGHAGLQHTGQSTSCRVELPAPSISTPPSIRAAKDPGIFRRYPGFRKFPIRSTVAYPGVPFPLP